MHKGIVSCPHGENGMRCVWEIIFLVKLDLADIFGILDFDSDNLYFLKFFRFSISGLPCSTIFALLGATVMDFHVSPKQDYLNTKLVAVVFHM